VTVFTFPRIRVPIGDTKTCFWLALVLLGNVHIPLFAAKARSRGAHAVRAAVVALIAGKEIGIPISA